jgi:hypothetical protein
MKAYTESNIIGPLILTDGKELSNSYLNVLTPGSIAGTH